jgi:hypothetical protein
VAHTAVLSIGISNAKTVVHAEAGRALRWVVALWDTVVETLAEESASRAVHGMVDVQVDANKVAMMIPWVVELNNVGFSEHLGSTRILEDLKIK